MCKIFRKRFGGFEKVATFASANETKRGRKVEWRIKSEKKVLKNLVDKKKGFTFVPTFASENAAIFLAPRRKVGYQKRFFDLLV